ncbi:MAG: alpha/beta fold hydrolase, partial [Hyphomicrobiaceae bacterium]
MLNLPPQFADRFERARTGVAYRIHGRGEPLVLFHGGAGSWNHWVRNIGPLTAQFTVIAFDSPSYGDSETVARDVSDNAYLRLVVDTVTEACA